MSERWPFARPSAASEGSEGEPNNQPLRADDERLPAVRARLFLLVRSLWRAGILQVPLSLAASDAPALQLLHPLWQRLRVELLGEQLLRDIVPDIERHLLSAATLRREESGLAPRAPVDWPATWRRGQGQPADAPLVTRQWERTLDLPENWLAVRALRALAHDAEQALATALSPDEAAPLRRLSERARQHLQAPPWRDLAAADDGREPLALPAATRPAYRALQAWWQQWQGWRQPAPGPQPLLDPELEPKWLFELLLLFELVAALARHFPTRQSRALADPSRRPAFVAQTPRGPLALFYQTGTMFAAQRSLEEVWGVPDIVIQLPGASPRWVILDAKNFGPSAHTQAMYKLLGYLYQFGYDVGGTHRFDEILAGALAFSTREREGFGLRPWQRAEPGTQAVLSFVLPPLPDPAYTGLDDFMAWLLERL